ncbi:hypothetical protein [Natronosalvus rutilus]|uniref:CopG family transcriptional regulator n=1 Tax=Natronosalvus rutilus TaxID=2953753 RepID=A0A9E7N7B5_9EURY|nr:hypothetical protein [Natronosalvus rutilus]UTF52156.1 hypothetical protein NGM29_10110 [Natronosalvus rutilus]
MASENHEDGAVSFALPADVNDWIDEEADRRGETRAAFCRQLLSATHAVTTDDAGSDGEGLDEDRIEPGDSVDSETLQSELEEQRTEFVDHVEDVRERVVQVKREADGKAPEEHDHDEYADRSAVEALDEDLETVAERLSAFEDRTDALSSLEADLEDLSKTVDSGFENFEDVLEHVLETTDELERRSTTLATAVLDLRERRDFLAAQERRRLEAERLQRAASRLGIQTATCAACSTAVSMGLLTEPTCPHCDTQFADVSKKRSFLGSHTLETGDPPALEPAAHAAVDTDETASVFETVEADAEPSDDDRRSVDRGESE